MKESMFTRVKSFFSGVNQMQDITNLLVDGSNNIGIEEYKDKSSQLMANVGWVYSANQVIADDCASVRLKLMHKMNDGDEEEVYVPFAAVRGCELRVLVLAEAAPAVVVGGDVAQKFVCIR